LGYQAEPHNIIALFDHEGTGDAGGRMIPGDPMQANTEVRAPMDVAWFQEHARAAIDFKNDLLFDEKSFTEFKQVLETPPLPPDTSVLKTQTEELQVQIDALNEQGFLAASEAELTEIRELAQKAQLHESIAKHAYACLGVV
jgi:hypothetical protein